MTKIAGISDIKIPCIMWNDAELFTISSANLFRKNTVNVFEFIGDEGAHIIGSDGRYFHITSARLDRPAEPLWLTFLKYWEFTLEKLKPYQVWHIEHELEDLGTVTLDETKAMLEAEFAKHRRWRDPGRTRKQTIEYMKAATSLEDLMDRLLGYSRY